MGEKVLRWLENIWQTLLSVVKVILFSRWRTSLPDRFSNPEELLILANGPSLNRLIEEHPEFVTGKTLLAVNFSVLSPLYEKLKPELYLIADPLFWIVPEKRQQLFGTLAEKTTWPLHFFIPVRAQVDKEWEPILKQNPHIHIHLYNTTPVEGYKGFCHFLFDRGLGVPRPHNVLIPSIMLGLRLPFKQIYLGGADHSWLPEIRVTDDNVVLVHQKHFYDTRQSRPDKVLMENLESSRLHTILYHMHVAFKAYFIIEEYAHHIGKEVINITPGSYIDAFKRMKV
ncbi:MAG: hypothetical protein LUG98_13625 [Tannerellaceae bacterium]|nr:hypothetical protein [Tannerellaceae bacterium]